MIVLDAIVVEAYSIHNVYNYLTPGYVALGVFAGVAAAWAISVVRSVAAERVDAHPSLAIGVVAAFLTFVPAALVAQNDTRVDRSDDYNC